MITTLRTDLTVSDVCNGFVYNQFEGKGLFGLGGKLTIQLRRGYECPGIPRASCPARA